ncbi:MAG TPA: TonB-dependent receptor, partial [Blastococcus sp.]
DTVSVGDEQPLYDYLNQRGSFVGLDNYKSEYLPILSRDVLHRIPTEDTTWESMVPVEVCELIRKRGFFGFPKNRGMP